MGADTQRLRRLIEDELGECCPADIDDRLARLEGLAGDIPEEPDRDVAALKALGNDTRYRLVRYLLAAHPNDLCVCELNPLVDVSDSAVSHALSDLTDAGLVSRSKRGTWRYYRATDRADAIVTALDRT